MHVFLAFVLSVNTQPRELSRLLNLDLLNYGQTRVVVRVARPLPHDLLLLRRFVLICVVVQLLRLRLHVLSELPILR